MVTWPVRVPMMMMMMMDTRIQDTCCVTVFFCSNIHVCVDGWVDVLYHIAFIIYGWTKKKSMDLIQMNKDSINIFFLLIFYLLNLRFFLFHRRCCCRCCCCCSPNSIDLFLLLLFMCNNKMKMWKLSSKKNVVKISINWRKIKKKSFTVN